MGVVEYRKNLRLLEAITIIVGSMIGSGILILPGAMLVEIQSPVAVITAWVVAAVLTIVGALTFAELAAMYPRAGGQYHFLKEGLGPFWSYLFGWSMFWVIMSGIIAGVAVAFSNFLDFFIDLPGKATPLVLGDWDTGLTLPAWGNAYVAIGLIFFLVGVNYVSSRFGGIISNVTVFGKYLGLLALVFMLFFLGDLHPDAFESAIPADATSWGLVGGFAVALSLTLFAYDGWPQATYVAAEIQNPKRNLPLALIVGPLLTAVIYILLTVSYFWVIPADAGVIIGNQSTSRIAIEAAVAAVGPDAAKFIAGVALVSVFGTVNAYVLTSPRIFQSMATDGALLRGMARLHPKHATPGYAMVLLGIWSSILVMTGLYVQLVTIVVFGLWLFYIPTAIAHMRLRKTQPDRERPFRTPLSPLLPIVFLLSAVFVVVALGTGRNWVYCLVALGVIALGIPAYLVQRRRAGKPAGDEPAA